ncbi:MAG: type 4a pilus biogenesis protein PilO [Bacteroidota bacterium]
MNTVRHWYEQRRWQVLSGLFAGLIGVATLLEVQPRLASTYALYQDWSTAEAKLASVESWEAQQAELEGQYEQLKERFANLYIDLPNSDQMSVILGLLQEASQAENVRLKQVRPETRVLHDTHDQIPLAVSVQGAFGSISAFLNRIERSHYLVKVVALRFEQATPEGTVLDAEIDLSVIILKEADARALQVNQSADAATTSGPRRARGGRP